MRWLEDESVGVVPLSAVHADSRVCVGANAKVKYGRKFYDAELLQTSGECVVLPTVYVRVLDGRRVGGDAVKREIRNNFD